MSPKSTKSKQECVKYVMESSKDYKTNTNDFILFFLCMENMNIVMANSGVENFILRNEVINRPEPALPVLHPDYQAVLLIDADLAGELMEAFDNKMSRYYRDMNIFESMRERVVVKQATAGKIFHDHFGPSVLSIVGKRLERKQYFEAYHELQEHFLSDPMPKKFRVNGILSTMYFEFQITMPVFTQLLESLTNVYAWLDRGVAVPDQTKVIYLIEAVKRGEGDFDFAINLISMGHVPFDEAARLLASRAEEPTARGSSKNKQQQQSSKGRGGAEAHQAAKKGKGKKGKGKSTPAPKSAGSSGSNKSQPCFDFQNGNCNRGDSCRYSHDEQHHTKATANNVVSGSGEKDEMKAMQTKYKAMEAKWEAEAKKQSDLAAKYKKKALKAQANNAYSRAVSYHSDSDSGGHESSHVIVKSSRWGDFDSESDSESDSDFEFDNVKPQIHMVERVNWRTQTAFPSPEPAKVTDSEKAVRNFVRPASKLFSSSAEVENSKPPAAEVETSKPIADSQPAVAATIVATNRSLNARVAAALLAKKATVAPSVTAAPAATVDIISSSSKELMADDDDVADMKADSILQQKVKAALLKKNAAPAAALPTATDSLAPPLLASSEATESAPETQSEAEQHLNDRVAALLAKKAAVEEAASAMQTPTGKTSLDDDLLLADEGADFQLVQSNSAKKQEKKAKIAAAAVETSPKPLNQLVTRSSTYNMVDTRASGKIKKSNEAHMVGSGKHHRRSNPKGTLRDIFDTGASHSMRPSAAGLQNFEPVSDPEETVLFGGNEDFSLPITGRGVDGIFKKILVVPGIKRALISGTRLMTDGFLQIYWRDRLFVYNDELDLAASGTLGRDHLVHRDAVTDGPTYLEITALIAEKAARKKAKRLAKLQPALSKELANGHFAPLSQLTEKQIINGKALNRPKAARELVGSEMLILHNRTMHAGRSKLINLVKHRTAIGFCCTLQQLLKEPMGDCVACHLGKFSKFPAPASFSQQPSENMAMICSDLEGPFKTKSVENNRYWQLHADRKSGLLMINFHKSKATAAAALMGLQSKYAEPLGLKIRFLQSDSDTIYKDSKLKSWAESNGVTLQYTAPYRHEGVIEAHMKSVLETVMTVLADSGLAEKHWQTVAEAAVFVHNSLPTTRSPEICPYTAVTGKVRDISSLVPIGYPATCKIYDEEGRSTLQANGQECVVVGYCEASNAYKVLTKTGRPLIRKDVVVDENYTVSKKHNHSSFKAVLQLDPEEDTEQRRDDFDIAISTGSSEFGGVTTRSRRSVTPMPVRILPPQLPAPQPPPPAPRISPLPTIAKSAIRPPSVRPSVKPDRLSFNTVKATSPGLPPVPKNMVAALQSKSALNWLRATNAEFAELIDRGVTLSTKPGEKTPPAFKSKIVYRVSKNSNPLLEELFKFKARVVACGYSSIFGVHYDESYSPTMLFKSLLIVLSIAKLEGWYKSNIDIGNAYLEALRTKPLYMWLPTDWTGGKKIKVKLARNLYGLKDAGLLWYVLIDKILQKDGYHRSIYDPCVYFKGSSILCLYVDDLAITGKLESEVDRLKKVIAKQVKLLKDLGSLSKFVGIEIEEDGDHLCLSQLETANTYVQQYVKNGRSVRHVPIEALHKLDEDSEEPPEEFRPIWEEVGKLRYMADRTRHDLQYVASKLGTKSAWASPKYQEAALDAMSYLQNTLHLKLKLGGKDKKVKLFGYADASFIAGDDSKSQLGYCFFLTRDSGAVVARSIKDKTVSLSSTESELKALTEAIKEAIWIRGLLGELGYPQEEATLIFQDNTSAIRLSEKIGSEGRTRHIINRINFIRQELQNKTVRLEHIPTAKMVADILTGPRAPADFEYLRGVLLEGHQFGESDNIKKT